MKHITEPIYYSSNEELEKDVSREDDTIGEIHTATFVIALVKEGEALQAKELVKRWNSHEKLVEALHDAHSAFKDAGLNIHAKGIEQILNSLK